jgi:glutathione peroxidase
MSSYRFLAFSTLLLSFAACGSSPSNTQEPSSKTSGVDTAAAKDMVAAKDPAAAKDMAPAKDAAASKSNIYALSVESLEGKPVDLASYRGKVTLVVNVASECGYTRQYAGLQKLHSELKDRGFAVLGFPSNEFGGQEPGSASDIREFCTSKFGVEFPMFAKTQTKGDQQSPVFAQLESATGKKPGWNFCKYLIGKDGEVLGFYPSKVAPDDAALRAAIEGAL